MQTISTREVVALVMVALKMGRDASAADLALRQAEHAQIVRDAFAVADAFIAAAERRTNPRPRRSTRDRRQTDLGPGARRNPPTVNE